MDPKLTTFVAWVFVAECCHRVIALSSRRVQTRAIRSLLLALRLLFVLSLSWKFILQPLQLFAETNLFKSILCVNAPCRPTTNSSPRLASPSAWANTVFIRWVATYDNIFHSGAAYRDINRCNCGVRVVCTFFTKKYKGLGQSFCLWPRISA